MLSLQVFVTLNVSRLANDRLTIKHKRQDPKICDIEAAYEFILAINICYLPAGRSVW